MIIWPFDATGKCENDKDRKAHGRFNYLNISLPDALQNV